MEAQNEQNIQIFEDSRRLWETDPVLRTAMERARERTVLVPVRKNIPCHEGDRRQREEVRVRVSRKRSLQAAASYRSKHVCVVSFADTTEPGGGVTSGADTQEARICRCSTLYPCLDTPALQESFYTPNQGEGGPLHSEDCIYSPGVTVFRYNDEKMELLPESGRFRVDVLSCAAPEISSPGCSEARLRNLYRKCVRRIFDIAAEHGAEVLVFGAYGTSPRTLARVFRDELEYYKTCFETVEFAMCSESGDEGNY